MKWLLQMAVAGWIMVMWLSSCQSDNISDGGSVVIDPPPSSIEVNPMIQRSTTTQEGLELGCIVILYSFEVVDNAGDRHTVESDEDFFTVLDSGLAVVDFIYPIEASVDGTVETIEDVHSLAETFSHCVPEGGFSTSQFPAYNISFDNSCFELQLPLTVQEVDGSTTTFSTEQAFDAAVADRPLFFVFPFEVVDQAGFTITIINPDHLFDVLVSCGGWQPDSTYFSLDDLEYIACYTVAFPLEVTLENGTTVEVQNHQQLCELMLRGEIVDFVYPLTLMLEDSTFVVQDQQALDAAISDCPTRQGEASGATLLFIGTQFVVGGEPCWSIVFPIEVVDSFGVVSTIHDQLTLENRVAEQLELVYPVSYIFNASGVSSTAESKIELIQDLESCM